MASESTTPVKLPKAVSTYTTTTQDPDLRSQINTVLLRDGHISKWVFSNPSSSSPESPTYFSIAIVPHAVPSRVLICSFYQNPRNPSPRPQRLPPKLAYSNSKPRPQSPTVRGVHYLPRPHVASPLRHKIRHPIARLHSFHIHQQLNHERDKGKEEGRRGQEWERGERAELGVAEECRGWGGEDYEGVLGAGMWGCWIVAEGMSRETCCLGREAGWNL